MFQQTFAIIRNTFFESIRQPVMLVVLMVATLLIILSNPLSGYTMSNDQKMLIDVGLATVFISGAILASFIATSVLGNEIENRTALTVISKPVARPLFVLGKFFGVAGALALATLYMSFVFLLVEEHSVLQTARDPVHVPVVVFGLGAAILGLAIGVWCNYFYGMVFSSTVICTTTPLAGLAYFFSLMFRHDFTFQPIGTAFKLQLWLGLGALLVAILVLTAIAIAASTRFGQVMTLCITVGFFFLGLLSDWTFGRPLAQMQQDWTQRIRTIDDAELKGMLGQRDIEQVRHWVLNLYAEHAQQKFSAWHCALLYELQTKWRDDLHKMTEAERQVFIATRETEAYDIAVAQLASELDQAGQLASGIEWPISKQYLVHELEWPLTVQRTNGECEVISEKRTSVYPPLLSRVAGAHQRMLYALYRIASSVVPNFQVLWLSDAITQEHKIPMGYLATSTLYGGLHIIAFLSLATLMFQRREVG